tara:strand:- start:591 stop:719 length:129 start_codon:yes stop_codon:yes gene_type:complete
MTDKGELSCSFTPPVPTSDGPLTVVSSLLSKTALPSNVFSSL